MFWRPGTGLAYNTDGGVVRHVLRIPDSLCKQTREELDSEQHVICCSKEKFNGNIDEYVKEEKVSCYVQVDTSMYIELMRTSWDVMNLWFIQLALVGDLQRFYHTIKLSFRV
ncbi:Reverse gyrase 1 [Gossypium arboreum]|uniref:Reverse gyrase 1 n=2 Tax=Gossypium arboreum TaxID=29729 RepID=A0A0B0NWK6_GOSAR|nr:Reverse gyrase 1 [Gossypium arboreum]